MNKPILSRLAVSMLLAGGALLVLATPTIHAQPAAPAIVLMPANTPKPPFATPLKWKATDVLVKPASDETHNLVSVKDPSIVRYNK